MYQVERTFQRFVQYQCCIYFPDRLTAVADLGNRCAFDLAHSVTKVVQFALQFFLFARFFTLECVRKSSSNQKERVTKGDLAWIVRSVQEFAHHFQGESGSGERKKRAVMQYRRAND